MSLFRRIFVVLEPQQEEQSALDRARYLARQTGASLHVFMCTHDVALGFARPFMSSRQRKDLLRTLIEGNRVTVERLLEPVRAEGIAVDSEVVWHRNPTEAILQALERSGCDLLMKLARTSGRMQEVIFTHLDWNIIRMARCPVLMVKQAKWDAVGQVLAAVNPAPEDAAHRRLNELILDTGDHLAKDLEFEFHVVAAYPPPPVYLPLGSGSGSAGNYRRKMSDMVRRNVGKLVERYGVDKGRRHLVEGQVDWVIPKVADELVAEFVLIGTVARRGVGGWTLGNTAERILHELNCDVLVVKAEQGDPAMAPETG